VIIYEYPFNERIRTYLRLERLFRRLSMLVSRDTPIDHHYALASLFEIVEVGARADLKSDVLKDLERHKQTFSSYRDNPAIDQDVLGQLLQQIDTCLHQVSSQPGRIGQQLTENDWLSSLRSRINIPGGTCEFDLPAYYAWQHEPASKRRADLDQWISSLAPLAESVLLLLRLLRDSGQPQRVMAQDGQFQQNLPQGRTFQLLRLALDDAQDLIPEISGNRLMVSIRLMRQGDDNRLHASHDSAAFDLTLCA
jgi:cell division protein ZapD